MRLNKQYWNYTQFGVDDKPSDISVAKWNHTFVVVKNLTVSNIIITKEILDDIYVVSFFSL